MLKVGTTIYVGRTLRTNAAGIAAFRRICEPLGYTVIAVPVTKVLHLKSAVTALPDGTVIGLSAAWSTTRGSGHISGRCRRKPARTWSISATAGC